MLDWFFTRKYGHPMYSVWAWRVMGPLLLMTFICIEMIAIFPI
jgi:hypothetical protein